MSGVEEKPPAQEVAASRPHSPSSPAMGENVAEAKAENALYQAPQWKLIWWRFKKHKLARIAVIVLILFYLSAAFSEFISPYGKMQRFENYGESPPSKIHIVHDGELVGPYIYGRKRELSMDTLQYKFVEDTSKVYPIRFLAQGTPYEMWGLIPADVHLFTTDEGAPPVFVFGADRLGRDLFTRIVYGGRVSLTIGLVGVMLGFVLGITLGAVSGYFGGLADLIIQRLIEFILALPTIPLWMALSAALPRDWSTMKTYFFITLILSLTHWATLGREVRGKLLSLREEDFVTAAKTIGASRGRIMFRHLLPSFTSHLIVTLTIAIPGMILGETALSFLGLGMQPPAVSWGVLLEDAQHVVAVSQYPWQLIPAIFVVVAVLAFNFVGDGIRDAADPYT